MSIAASLASNKTSGLGIDFAPSDHSPSEPGHLWEDHGIYAIHSAASSFLHPSPIQPKRKMSRWSESTRASQLASLASGSEAGQSSPARQGSHISHAINDMPSMCISEAAQELFMRGRGSDDSQASYGPTTPTEDSQIPPIQIVDAEREGMYSAPRKAPLPPSTGKTSPVLASLPGRSMMAHTGSVTQSMMRTLSKKKKEGIIPPPLELIPAIPRIPPNIDLVAVVQQDTSSSAQASPIPAMHIVDKTLSEQLRRDSGPAVKTPRASVGSLFRSIRKSMSGESRKSSAASISAPLHLTLPTSTASPISKKNKAKSPKLPSPLMREARSKPGNASKSYDFGFSMTRNVAGGNGQRSPVTRPMTAPHHKTAFSANLQCPAPATGAVSPGTVSVESPLPQLSIRFAKAGGNIQYNDPWGTYDPARSFVSSIPVSPGQPECTGETEDGADRSSSSPSEASLYKQRVLAGSENEYKPTVQVPRRRSELESAIPIRCSISGKEVRSNSIPRPSAPAYLPALNFPDHRISLMSIDSTASCLLSRGSELPPPRKGSRNRSVDQAIERVAAPHLYLETLGAMSLRNPFAGDVNAGKSAGQGSKVEKDSRRRGSAGDKRRADDASLDGATIEFSHVRRRSSGTEASPNMPQRGTIVQNNWITLPAPPVKFVSEAQVISPAVDRTSGQQQESPGLATSSEIGGIDITLSPIPIFHNPFLAKLASNASSPNAPSVTFASPKTGRYLQRPTGTEDLGRPSLAIARNASASEMSLRRPSCASYASSSYGQFPTRPNQLEARRMTDFSASRGIRVSIDTDLY